MIVERHNSRPARWTTWLGLVMVPMLVAGGLLAATWDSDSRQENVAAAIVNLDEAVTIDGEYVPLGRQLSAALVDSDRVQNLSWEQASASGAAEGLASGRYAAVVTIPREFSAAATSYSGEAAQAHQATIQVETSSVAGVSDATLGKVVAQEAAELLNETLTSAYLEQVYIGIGELGEQFVTVAEGARELADGAEQLADGVEEFAGGLSQLTDGTGDLADGSRQLATGLATLASEVEPLPGGARQLADGVGEAADGAKELSGGLGELAGGLRTLKSETSALPTAAEQLADGSGGLSTGLADYVGGVDQLIDQTLASLPLQAQLAGGVAQLSTGASGLAAGLAAYQGELTSQAAQAADAAAGITQLAAGLPDTATQLTAMIRQACPGVDTAQLDAAIPVCVASLSATSQALNGAAGGLDQPDGGTGQSLRGGADALAGGLAEFSEGLSGGEAIDVEETTRQLQQLKAGGAELKTGAAELAEGVGQFAAGMTPLADGIGQSADGAGVLASALNALASGLVGAADGADTFAAGLPELVSGINQAAAGAEELADGVDQLNSGTLELDDAASQLDDGSSRIAEGSRELADGLAEGKDQIPNYSASERTNLSEVVASPLSTANLRGTASVSTGWATLLLVLALWLGALATYVVLKALSPRLLSSALPTAYLVAETVVPGAMVVASQALVVAVLGQLALRLPFGQSLAVTGLLLLAGLAFVAVNHALTAWLGGIGRLISVGLAVLAAASMLTSAEPAVFGALRGLSPLTPALAAIRGVITGAPGVAAEVFALLGWLALGLLAGAVAVIRGRATSFDALAAGHALPG